jgi:hypothetical protein
LNGGRHLGNELIDLAGEIGRTAEHHDLVNLGKRSGNFGRDLRNYSNKTKDEKETKNRKKEFCMRNSNRIKFVSAMNLFLKGEAHTFGRA